MTEQIERHRTAQRRSALSSPMQHLLRFGFLDGSRSLFDYGCGRGDDLRMLSEMNVPATGWDPVFRSEAERQPADIVNLGFVLNVIEDADERRETLKSAFGLARKVLVVSVMLGYQSKREQFATFEDGVRTQRNTFQKYYAQDEFRVVRGENPRGERHPRRGRHLPGVQGRRGGTAVPARPATGEAGVAAAQAGTQQRGRGFPD